MNTHAVVLEAPEKLNVSKLQLTDPTESDVVVDMEFSGISTGTERLLWTGQMPKFPGMGYPLVPGYESVGRIVSAGAESGHAVGERVYVPGARCYGEVRGLFGGAASKVVVGGDKVIPVSDIAGFAKRCCWRWPPPRTTPWPVAAKHEPPCVRPISSSAMACSGRLLARMVVAAGFEAPTVWELNPERCTWRRRAMQVMNAERRHPSATTSAIYDVSGDCTHPGQGHRPPGLWRRSGARGLLPRASELQLRTRPSCAKRRSAPPPNGSARTCWRSRNWPRSGRLSLGRPDHPHTTWRPTPPTPTAPPSATRRV